MPIDASIPLQVRTPEPGPTNLLDSLARVLQIKNEQARQQLIPGQIALQNQQVQLGQQQLDSTRVLNEAYKQPGMFTTGADGMPTMNTDVLGKYLSDNGQGHLVPSLTKTGLELNEQAGKVREQRSKLASEEADYTGLVGAGAMTTAADGTKTADPGKLSLGLAHAAAIYGPGSPSAQGLQALQQDPSKANDIAAYLIQQSPKQRELATAAETAAARKQTADTGAAKLPGELAVQQLTQQSLTQKITGTEPIQPSQRQTEAMTEEQRKETQRHNAAEEADRVKQLGIEGGRLQLQRQQLGFDMSGGVSPAAQMAADGRMDPQTLRSMLRRSPGLINQIKQVDPQFDEANLDNRYNTLKEFTNTSVGKAGGQALALNVLIHHADLYQQAADALKNGSFKPGNAAYNAVASAFGAAPPQTADLVARFLAGETGKVATGGVPAEGEINGILKSLSSANSPDQIASAANALLQIAGGRATPLMERVHNAKLDNVVQVLGPDAQAILKRRGFDPATMKPAAQAGAQSGYIVGRKYGNLTYQGGDPNQQTSWK